MRNAGKFSDTHEGGGTTQSCTGCNEEQSIATEIAMNHEAQPDTHPRAPRLSRLRGGGRDSPRTSTTRAGEAEVSGVRQVIEAVGRCISFDAVDLPTEFFPAHLPVAIVEAVFRFQPGPEEQSSQVAMRYCRHFGLAYRRRNKFKLPSVNEQETVSDLIGRYDERGVEGMANEVFETRYGVSETAMCGAESVVRIAKALRHIGVDVLQDVQDRPAHELGEAVRSVPGTDASIARLLLTYVGDDDFVVADDHVRQFAAEATGHRTVSASWAARLVRQAAHELILSPRYLDYRIYRYRVER